MILWFSGTGNSRYIAQKLAEQLQEEQLCLNDRIRANDTSPIQVNGRLVVVTPTYAWRIPRVVRDWLRRTALAGAEQVWFIMSCGSEIGNADRYNRVLCQEKGLTCMGTTQIVMPENYIAMFSAPVAGEAREIVAGAEPAIRRAADLIAEGSPFPAARNNLYDRFMSGPVNPVFYAFCVKDSAFVAGDGCTGCGLCTHLCPMGNIVIRGGKPSWGGHCTHCMSCICYCPVEAIEYGRKSIGQPRYRIEMISGDGN